MSVRVPEILIVLSLGRHRALADRHVLSLVGIVLSLVCIVRSMLGRVRQGRISAR